VVVDISAKQQRGCHFLQGHPVYQSSLGESCKVERATQRGGVPQESEVASGAEEHVEKQVEGDEYGERRVEGSTGAVSLSKGGHV